MKIKFWFPMTMLSILLTSHIVFAQRLVENLKASYPGKSITILIFDGPGAAFAHRNIQSSELGSSGISWKIQTYTDLDIVHESLTRVGENLYVDGSGNLFMFWGSGQSSGGGGGK